MKKFCDIVSIVGPAIMTVIGAVAQIVPSMPSEVVSITAIIIGAISTTASAVYDVLQGKEVSK